MIIDSNCHGCIFCWVQNANNKVGLKRDYRLLFLSMSINIEIQNKQD